MAEMDFCGRVPTFYRMTVSCSHASCLKALNRYIRNFGGDSLLLPRMLCCSTLDRGVLTVIARGR